MNLVGDNVVVDGKYFPKGEFDEVYERESSRNNPNIDGTDTIISIRCDLCGAFSLKWDDEFINCRNCGELV